MTKYCNMDLGPANVALFFSDYTQVPILQQYRVIKICVRFTFHPHPDEVGGVVYCVAPDVRLSVRIFVSGADLFFFHIPHTHPLGCVVVFFDLVFYPHFSAKIALFILIPLISGNPCQIARPLDLL